MSLQCVAKLAYSHYWSQNMSVDNAIQLTNVSLNEEDYNTVKGHLYSLICIPIHKARILRRDA